MRGITKVLVFVGGAVLGASSVAAQPLGALPGRWWERPKVAERVGLSQEQVKKLDALTIDQARVMVDLKAAVEKAEIDVRAAAEAEPFEPKKVREAFAGLQQARGRLESERFEMLLKVRSVLSADQWRLLREFAKARRLEREGETGKSDKPMRPGGRFRQPQ